MEVPLEQRQDALLSLLIEIVHGQLSQLEVPLVSLLAGLLVVVHRHLNQLEVPLGQRQDVLLSQLAEIVHQHLQQLEVQVLVEALTAEAAHSEPLVAEIVHG